MTVGRELMSDAIQHSTSSLSPITSQDALAVAVKGANANMPKMLDQDTRMDGAVAGAGNQLSYLYTLVNYSSHELKPDELHQFFQERAIEVACAPGSKVQVLFRAGITVNHIYRAKDNQEIARVQLRPDVCTGNALVQGGQLAVAPHPSPTWVLPETFDQGPTAVQSRHAKAKCVVKPVMTDAEIESCRNR